MTSGMLGLLVAGIVFAGCGATKSVQMSEVTENIEEQAEQQETRQEMQQTGQQEEQQAGQQETQAREEEKASAEAETSGTSDGVEAGSTESVKVGSTESKEAGSAESKEAGSAKSEEDKNVVNGVTETENEDGAGSNDEGKVSAGNEDAGGDNTGSSGTKEALNGEKAEDEQAKVAQEPQVTLSGPAEYMASLAAGTVLAEGAFDRSVLKDYFCCYEIPEAVFQRIDGKSYRENKDVSLGDLRYMKVLHYNFDHEVQVGEAIVAASLADDYVNIFYELFLNEYEIYSMYLVDNFWTGDATTSDSASIDKNNSSSFCYRPATGSSKLSKHSYGRAIDINPQQNPYVSFPGGKPKWVHENASDYIDRTTGYAHMITYDDVCYQIFHKYGFTWGGDYKNVKDYQHFQK